MKAVVVSGIAMLLMAGCATRLQPSEFLIQQEGLSKVSAYGWAVISEDLGPESTEAISVQMPEVADSLEKMQLPWPELAGELREELERGLVEKNQFLLDRAAGSLKLSSSIVTLEPRSGFINWLLGFAAARIQVEFKITRDEDAPAILAYVYRRSDAGRSVLGLDPVEMKEMAQARTALKQASREFVKYLGKVWKDEPTCCVD